MAALCYRHCQPGGSVICFAQYMQLVERLGHLLSYLGVPVQHVGIDDNTTCAKEMRCNYDDTVGSWLHKQLGLYSYGAL